MSSPQNINCKIIDSNTVTKMNKCHNYNLRPRNVDSTIVKEVKEYLDNMKENYNLRSNTNTPRVNYARFYTCDPESYQYHFLRRSSRINNLDEPKPDYSE